MTMLKATRLFLIFLLSILHCITSDHDFDLKKNISILSRKMDSCSEFFEYRRIDDFVNGKLELPNIKIGDTVKMTFNRVDYEPIPIFKGIFLPDGSPQAVMDQIQNGQLIKYRVDFPLTANVPELLKILINGKELCSTKFNASGDTLVLQHTMRIINGSIPVFNYNINIPNFVDTENANSGLSPLIYGGTEVSRGEYPWLTAIYKKQKTDLTFICGGSLVTSRIVLTAAHCFQGLGNNAKKIVAMLGRHDLNDYRKGSLLIQQIKTLILHPEYKTGKDFSDADLALLEMKQHVSFTKFIKPICLWSELSDESLIVNHSGVVAGWGSDAAGKTISSVPKKVKMNIVSESTCLRSSLAFTVLTSTRTLCAGNRDGSGACEGDSGGGLMLKRSGRWTLRGVVSGGLTYEEGCNLREYVVFCDIAKHTSWLQQYINQNKPPTIDSLYAICGKTDTEQRKQPTTQSIEEICGTSGAESRSKHSWLAAIYIKRFTGLVFGCTGILISARSVLASANDFKYTDDANVSPDETKIYLGRYDLQNIHENVVLIRDIATINFHPDFKYIANSNFQQNNLVLLQMNAPVSFTEFVKPICLRSVPNGGQSQIIDLISGWEYRGVLYETFTVPLSIEINKTSIQNCELWGYNANISSRILCTPQGENQFGPILLFTQNGRWIIRGITALIYTNNTYSLENYFAYSDIAKYLPWIESNML